MTSCQSSAPSTLLTDHAQWIKDNAPQGQVLDLACGNGRNGLYLDEIGFDVVFADRNEAALAEVESALLQRARTTEGTVNKRKSCTWHVDFETEAFDELATKKFSVIIVFRYLHRPLFEQIKAALLPGGIIIYETFNWQQADFGRPKNPNFLLKQGELTQQFSGWVIKHDFEGLIEVGSEGVVSEGVRKVATEAFNAKVKAKTAISQIVAQKD